MDEITVKDVTREDVDDLCWVCVSPDVRDDPDWIRGVADKKKWALEMLPKWGPFAKVAYENGSPAGMIQYRPLPEERVVHIDYVYVPAQSCWGKGIATRLLNSLMEDVQKPMGWFDNRRPLALVTTTFPGGDLASTRHESSSREKASGGSGKTSIISITLCSQVLFTSLLPRRKSGIPLKMMIEARS
jgi:hypothetical protein